MLKKILNMSAISFRLKLRDIHYGKKVNKNIYGVTTTDEQKELAEEGIEITSIPWVKKEN